MRPIKHFITHLKDFLLGMVKHMHMLFSDKIYLRMMFYLKMGYRLPLEHPLTYNEKIQWLKLYDRNPEYTRMVDKITAKEYVAEIIGSEQIIPTIGIWNDPNDIDFNGLPDKFVLKSNHSGGGTGVVVCHDKNSFNLEQAKEDLRKSLAGRTYPTTKEWPYKNIVPRIFAEEYLENDDSQGLTDYKFLCFGGKVGAVLVCEGRFSEGGVSYNYYDREWNRLPCARGSKYNDKLSPCPAHFDKMVKISEQLSEGISFVRVDLYNVGGKIYFSELTFYPASGFTPFEPSEWDRKFGDMIDLSMVKTTK